MQISIPVLAAVAALTLCSCGGSGSSTTTAGVRSATTSSVTTVTHTTTTSATSSTAAATTSSANAGQPFCQAADLALAFLGQQGATGHGELGFALRNTGSSSCHTIGFPGVQFLARDGSDLPTAPTHATRDVFGVSPLRGLEVGPGQSVSFRLTVTHGVGSSAGCTTAYGLQVIAPNDTATMRVSIPDGATECGTAIVSPLRAGDSAYP